MGQASRQAMARRAAAVLDRDPERPDIKRLVGKTVTILGAGMSTDGSVVGGWVQVRDEDGKTHRFITGEEIPVTETGILGCDLENHYTAEDLREMLMEVIHEPPDHLTEGDIEKLEEEFANLGHTYEVW